MECKVKGKYKYRKFGKYTAKHSEISYTILCKKHVHSFFQKSRFPAKARNLLLGRYFRVRHPLYGITILQWFSKRQPIFTIVFSIFLL